MQETSGGPIAGTSADACRFARPSARCPSNTRRRRRSGSEPRSGAPVMFSHFSIEYNRSSRSVICAYSAEVSMMAASLVSRRSLREIPIRPSNLLVANQEVVPIQAADRHSGRGGIGADVRHSLRLHRQHRLLLHRSRRRHALCAGMQPAHDVGVHLLASGPQDRHRAPRQRKLITTARPAVWAVAVLAIALPWVHSFAALCRWLRLFARSSDVFWDCTTYVSPATSSPATPPARPRPRARPIAPRQTTLHMAQEAWE